MSFKKFSLIFLTILCFKAYSMEEQKNEEPIEQTSHFKNPNKLNRFCARSILKNNIDSEILPPELKEYLKNLTKFKIYKKELKKHVLIPAYKKYLISCFDHLTFQELKELLKIGEKANIAPEKYIVLQMSIATICKEVFCMSPLLTFVSLSFAIFEESFNGDSRKVFEEIRSFYNNALNLTNEDKRCYLNACIDIAQSPATSLDAPCLKALVSLAKKNYASALFRLGMIQTQIALANVIAYINELTKIDAIDYAIELIGYIISVTNSLAFSYDVSFLQK